MRDLLAEASRQASLQALRLRRPASFALVASGFGAGVAQVLLFRELLVVCYGNEISIAAMLTGWLLYGALGSIIARRAAARSGDLRSSARRATKLAPLTAPAVIVSMLLLRSAPQWLARIAGTIIGLVGVNSVTGAHLRTLIWLQPGETLGLIHIAAVVAVAALPPAALAGAQFAANCHLLVRLRGGEADAVGSAYSFDASGHLLGGVVLGWVVLQWLDPFYTAAAAALVSFIAAAWLAVALPAPSRRHLTVAGLLVIAAQAALLLLARPFDGWSLTHFRWRDQRLLASGNSVYGNVAMVRHGADGVAVYENGTPAGESPPPPTVQVFTQFAMLQQPQADYVLMIGGGAFGGLQEVLKHNPTRIDYLELDPLALELSRQWTVGDDAAALRDPRVNCLTQDGRLWVKRIASESLRAYDVILVSTSEPASAQLNRYYTADFFREARAILRPGGVFTYQLPASEFYMGPQLLKLNACIWRTLSSVFPHEVLLTGDTLCAVASVDRPFLIADPTMMQARLTQMPVDVPIFQAQMMDLLDSYNVQFLRSQLDKAPHTPLNTDMHPVGYFYDQAVWVAKYHPSTLKLFDRLERLSSRPLMRVVLIIAGIVLALGLLRPVRATFTPLAVLASGFLGMVLELVLLSAFQSQYGAVYGQIGVIIGAFMVGLALGGLAAGRYLRGLRRPSSAAWMLAAIQVAIGGVAWVLPPILSALWGHAAQPAMSLLAARVVFPVLTMVVGLGVGAEFPLASWTAAWGKWSLSRAATALYALDLVGAAAGAMIAGTALLPVLGIPATCHLAAVISVSVAALLALRAAKFPN